MAERGKVDVYNSRDDEWNSLCTAAAAAAAVRFDRREIIFMKYFPGSMLRAYILYNLIYHSCNPRYSRVVTCYYKIHAFLVNPITNITLYDYREHFYETLTRSSNYFRFFQQSDEDNDRRNQRNINVLPPSPICFCNGGPSIHFPFVGLARSSSKQKKTF